MSSKPHVLVVDDEEELRETVQEYLTLHDFSVATADGGAQMRERLAERAPDLVVLDLRMPGEDGLTLARWLKENTSAQVVMLTAMAEPVDRIVGLEMGADDYMAKPFHPRELVARIRTVLRRAPADETPADPNRVRLGRCWLDLAARCLHHDDGRQERLTETEFGLLNAFVQNTRKVLTRDDLLSMAASRDEDPFDRSIDIRINRIRKKVEKDPANPEVIKTVRGSGYIFEPGRA